MQKAEPLINALDDPVAQLAIAGLPFVSIGINLLKLGLELAKVMLLANYKFIMLGSQALPVEPPT